MFQINDTVMWWAHGRLDWGTVVTTFEQTGTGMYVIPHGADYHMFISRTQMQTFGVMKTAAFVCGVPVPDFGPLFA